MKQTLKFIYYWLARLLLWPFLCILTAHLELPVMRSCMQVTAELRRGERDVGDTVEASRSEARILQTIWLWAAILALAIWK